MSRRGQTRAFSTSYSQSRSRCEAESGIDREFSGAHVGPAKNIMMISQPAPCMAPIRRDFELADLVHKSSKGKVVSSLGRSGHGVLCRTIDINTPKDFSYKLRGLRNTSKGHVGPWTFLCRRP